MKTKFLERSLRGRHDIGSQETKTGKNVVLFTFGYKPNPMIDKRVELAAYIDKFGDLTSAKCPIQGIFQMWGDKPLYDDGRTFAQTVGVVLGDDGQVYVAPPNYIKVQK